MFWGFPKIRGTLLRLTIIKTVVFGIYSGVSWFFGNYFLQTAKTAYGLSFGAYPLVALYSSCIHSRSLGRFHERLRLTISKHKTTIELSKCYAQLFFKKTRCLP